MITANQKNSGLSGPVSGFLQQTTLKETLEFSGRGLHTGTDVVMRLVPAPADTGYVFVRVDLANNPEIPARLALVTATERGTVLSQGGASAATVEHLLSGLYGLGVHNVRVELNGPEVPIMDGSAQPVVEAVLKTGIQLLDAQLSLVTLDGPFTYEADGKTVLAEPCDHLEIEYKVNYPGAIGAQSVRLVLDADSYQTQISSARTFCNQYEVDAMRAAGLIKGGDLNCAIVYGQDGPLNPPLRFEDEVVRHKLLDFVGDLALAGRRIHARFTIEKAGHYHHVEAMKALMNTVPNAPKLETRRTKPMSSEAAEPIMNAQEIEKMLPHRYPMALVDRIVELEKGKRIVGIKNVTMNEWFFQGHFPGHPIMPGVLIVEAMAQVGGVLVMKSLPELEGTLTYFMGIDNAKFRRPVVPGDSIRLELTANRMKGKIAKLHGEAFVDGKLVCEADVTCMTIPRDEV